jgi:hypothetical protein
MAGAIIGTIIKGIGSKAAGSMAAKGQAGRAAATKSAANSAGKALASMSSGGGSGKKTAPSQTANDDVFSHLGPRNYGG